MTFRNFQRQPNDKLPLAHFNYPRIHRSRVLSRTLSLSLSHSLSLKCTLVFDLRQGVNQRDCTLVLTKVLSTIYDIVLYPPPDRLAQKNFIARKNKKKICDALEIRLTANNKEHRNVDANYGTSIKLSEGRNLSRQALIKSEVSTLRWRLGD